MITYSVLSETKKGGKIVVFHPFIKFNKLLLITYN